MLYVFILAMVVLLLWALWPYLQSWRDERKPTFERAPTPQEIEDAAMKVIVVSLIEEPYRWEALIRQTQAQGGKVDWLYNAKADVGIHIDNTRVWVMSGAKDMTRPTGKHTPSFHWQMKIFNAAKPLIRLAESEKRIGAMARIVSGFKDKP